MGLILLCRFKSCPRHFYFVYITAMSMGRERKYMPFLFFFVFLLFILGFSKMVNNIRPATKAIALKNSMCGDMLISQAIIIAQGSECMEVGSLNVSEYECNEEIKRISFPMNMKDESSEKSAVCHVFTNSGNAYLQLKDSK